MALLCKESCQLFLFKSRCTKEIIDTMGTKGYWKTKAGKSPDRQHIHQSGHINSPAVGSPLHEKYSIKSKEPTFIGPCAEAVLAEISFSRPAIYSPASRESARKRSVA